MIDKRNIRTMTKRELASEINSFNNACFTKVETLSHNGRTATFFHFIASDFALQGIKNLLGSQFIYETSNGYYVNYTDLSIASRNLTLA